VNFISESSINLKEAADNLRDYSENLETDKNLLLEIEERLDYLDKLKRKYGPSLQNIVDNLEKFAKELQKIEFAPEKLIEIEEEITLLEKKLGILSQNLSKSRKNISKTLSMLIENEIVKLEMAKAKFDIQILEKEINIKGLDDVEFLITTNPGEPLKPLSKIASGGETSRVVLAIKTVFANEDNIGTVIFDEIDSGISGKASQTVATELAKLSKSHQVLCITHQPIIASMADRYFYVEKNQKENQTEVIVKILENEDKQRELAKLAGGTLDEEYLLFAKQLLEKASITKQI
jgi:DNA repair protein RecN (Recombination protein N)